MSGPASPPPPAAEPDCRPQVVLPPAGVPTWAIAVAACGIGLSVLLFMNGHRADLAAPPPARDYAAPATPPLPPSLRLAPGEALVPDTAVPAGEAMAPAPFADPIDQGPPPPPAFSRPVPMRGGSEAAMGGTMFATQPMPGAPQPGGTPRVAVGGGSAVVFDAGRATAEGGDDKSPADAAARASLIRNRPAVIAQGEIIAATLETPVNSTRPGPIRAVVSRDVRGFDGSRILVPRGSRLIGEYRADPQGGRRRILATWTRVIRPDGVAIRIDSPAGDAVGGAGLPGRVDTHFLAKFANAALQSALQIGVNLASRAGNGSVIIGNTPQVAGAMGQNIIPGADDPPTVSVRAGAPVSVFVARDLDFSGVPRVR